MKARRSVRRFRGDAPPREAIMRLIEAAITAPSASNKQPWRFLVISKRSVIDDLATGVRQAVDRIAQRIEPESEPSFRAYGDYFTRFEKAPVVVAVLFRSLTLLSHLAGDALAPDDRRQILRMERDSGLIGSAMAMQNLLLMASDMGLGASGMTGPLVADDHIRRILDISPSWELAALIPVGYPAEEPPPVERKPAERVVTWIE
jgi:nitroreductase